MGFHEIIVIRKERVCPLFKNTAENTRINRFPTELCTIFTETRRRTILLVTIFSLIKGLHVNVKSQHTSQIPTYR